MMAKLDHFRSNSEETSGKVSFNRLALKSCDESRRDHEDSHKFVTKLRTGERRIGTELPATEEQTGCFFAEWQNQLAQCFIRPRAHTRYRASPHD